MVKLKLLSCLILILVGNVLCLGQKAPVKLKDDADRNFKNKEYRNAATIYRKYLGYGGDKSVYKNLGISLYHTNELADAETFLTEYYSTRPKDLDVVYFLGKVFHHEMKFDKAIEFYKYYLSLTKPSNPLYASVVADVKRCGNAKKIKYQEQDAISENSGNEVNSIYDEFNPVVSPNYFGRIYFTSNQPVDTGEGDAIRLLPMSYNMFGADIQVGSGLLGKGSLLNINLASQQDEVLYGFNKNGRVLFFGKGDDLGDLGIFAENTNIDPEDSNRIQMIDASFLQFGQAIDIYPFSDSILIFSSDRPGGFGGYDLYYSEFKNGEWGEPVNFGDKINSQFDERSPFLSNDGRTLYFSSNNYNTLGGFDIFTAYYLDKDMEWSTPVNMSLPINSPGDDLFFKLTEDGLKAVFASDRKTGYGGFDLYNAFFKSVRNEQLVEALPNVFFHVPDFKLNSQEYKDEINQSKLVSYTVEPMFYIDDASILQAKNKKQIDQLIELANRFPTTTFNFEINSESNVSSEIELYFGIKRGEVISNYMMAKGVAGNRITIQSLGNLYPIARNMVDGKPSISGQNLNRRIEVRMHHLDSLPLRITYKQPFVSDLLKVGDAAKFRKQTQGLAFRVQFVTLRQMYTGDIYTLNPDILIESVGGSGVYRYLSGLFDNYNDAKAFREVLINNGLKDAFVVPYIDNERYTPETLTESIMNRYPDLRKYYLDL